jgi:hypothetical protein
MPINCKPRLFTPKMPRTFALVSLALSMIFGVAVNFATSADAQTSQQMDQAIWTTGSAAECPAKSYVWYPSGDDMQFRDQAGYIDVGKVIAPTDNQWDDRFVGPTFVQTWNLPTERNFARPPLLKVD